MFLNLSHNDLWNVFLGPWDENIPGDKKFNSQLSSPETILSNKVQDIQVRVKNVHILEGFNICKNKSCLTFAWALSLAIRCACFLIAMSCTEIYLHTY